STMPRLSNTSSVRAWRASARELPDGAESLSTTRQERPWRRSWEAIVRPVGPAPTTSAARSSFRVSAIDLLLARGDAEGSRAGELAVAALVALPDVHDLDDSIVIVHVE